jgi:hypothetical protein
VLILNAESATRVGPFNIQKLETDDATGAALDASLVGKENTPVLLRSIAVRGAAIDALLPLAVEADIPVDNPDVSAIAIDVIRVEGKFALDGGRIKNACAAFRRDHATSAWSPLKVSE